MGLHHRVVGHISLTTSCYCKLEKKSNHYENCALNTFTILYSTTYFALLVLPIFRISRLPLCEVLVHHLRGDVPGEQHGGGVALKATYPEAGWTMTSRGVQIDHVHLLVKTCSKYLNLFSSCLSPA